MDYEYARQYFLSKPYTTEDFPFTPDVAVFKVRGKMFATLSVGKGGEKGTDGKLAGKASINLKCDPDEAIMLRDIFTSVIPGYHMNKRLWNTVILDDSIPQGEVERMIDNSFMLVVKGMSKAEQDTVLLQLNDA